MLTPSLISRVEPFTFELRDAFLGIRHGRKEEDDVRAVFPVDCVIVPGEFATEELLDVFDYVFVSWDGDRKLSTFRILPSHSSCPRFLESKSSIAAVSKPFVRS
ncbi:MAG: hypothetical protein J0I08_21240 [Rhizobiales bacterium]|nr:hypothetical protein [Hyphomicrobiales bacterium]